MLINRAEATGRGIFSESLGPFGVLDHYLYYLCQTKTTGRALVKGWSF